MKLISTILLLLSFNLIAVASSNHYVSASGSDANPGTMVAPWKTIGKVNASMASIIPGDSILFQCGGIYYGSLIPTKSGTPALPIVISSYGTGAKPVISGLITLTGWSNPSGNIWECTASTLKATVNIFTINGVPYDVGRTPNANQLWNVYQSASTTQLTSTSAGTAPIGGEVIIKKNSYTISRSIIVSQSGNTITYAPVNGIDNNNPVSASAGKPGFGFFYQRFAASLDQQGEWYYNKATNKMQVYSTVNPSGLTIKASSIDTLLLLGKQTNITVSGIAFEGAGMYAIESNLGSAIIIKNCDFNNNTKAVYMWNTDDAVITGNTANNCFNSAYFVVNRQRKRVTITSNYCANTGKLIGIGTFPTNYNFKAIVAETDTTRAGNYVNVLNNTVLHTGYMGIEFKGANVLIKNNYVRYFDSTLDDGGGIYCFNSIPATSLHWYNNAVIGNIVGDAIGAWQGTDRAIAQTPDVAGIYYDEQVENILTTNNTVFNVRGNGFQLNAPLNIILYRNTVYNCDVAIQLNKKAIREISGVAIKYNTFYQKTASQYNFFHINTNLTSPSSMTIAQSLMNLWDMDSNYITNLKAVGYGYYYSATGLAYTFPPAFNQATWIGTYGHDVHSTSPPITVTPTNTRLFINPSDSILNVRFYDSVFTEPNGTDYSNSLNLDRGYTSKVLIYKGKAATPNIPPVAKIDTVADRTLPANSITLRSLSTDGDGTINSYKWTYESGPGATIATGTLINTLVNNMLAGSHRFKLVVTDNNGAKDSAYITVVVNPAVVPPNMPPTITAQPVTITTTLPSNSINVRSSPRDADGTIVSTVWTKQDGPACTIVTPNDSVTVISNLVEGTYNFLVTTTDNSGAIATANVHVTVLPAPVNTIPIPDAGSDTTIVLPTNSVTLHGSGTPTTAGATITGYLWAITGGPVGATLGSSTSATTTLNNLTEGVYTIELTITDSNGMIAKDSVTVTVDPAPAPPSRAVLLFNIKVLP